MQELIWGVSALNHDASITVMRGNDILFAAHSERYSRIKNDELLNKEIIDEALSFGKPSKIIWYEKPLLKKSRYFYSGQYKYIFEESPKSYLRSFGLTCPIHYVGHHESHAAAGFYTSPFKSAAIIVCDAIGEWDCISIWKAAGSTMEKVKSIKYPDSIGLLYSAFTDRIGLKANEEEYILMGMAAYGIPKYVSDIKNDFILDMSGEFSLKENVHHGIDWWRTDLKEQDYYDIAASIQQITEEYIINLAKYAKSLTDETNLVFMGGVALNCVANEKLARASIFSDLWIMPNPGDAGSSLGAILAHTRQKANWKGPYLGTSIDGLFDVDAALQELEKNKIIGIAFGRAEFGPRAFGHRSLIADPRGNDIKDRVNDIKKRQRFRPFAPMIMEEFAHEYFDMPVKTSPYMQFTAKCKYPELFPAICHVDGSSRVQTVNQEQSPLIYNLLKRFYEKTGCPMLLNTSLNIKGEPLVNTCSDARRFSEKYNVKVF